MILPRRGFLLGLLAAGAAPAIIRTQGLLMPIKPKLAIGDGVELLSTAHPVPITRGGLMLMGRNLRPIGGSNDVNPLLRKEYRWVRETIMGESDLANVEDFYSKGWLPVYDSEKPSLIAKGIVLS